MDGNILRDALISRDTFIEFIASLQIQMRKDEKWKETEKDGRHRIVARLYAHAHQRDARNRLDAMEQSATFYDPSLLT